MELLRQELKAGLRNGFATMIPVMLAPEPPDFDTKVRQPGLSAIDELVGRPPRVVRRGQKREKVASREQDIPAGKFPALWRNVLQEMYDSYDRRCAYLAMYIHEATGHRTVDHVLPKSRAWNQVYEWANYRLCAGIINAKKGRLTTLVDPFSIGPGWFALNLRTWYIQRGEDAPPSEWGRVDATLPLLNQRVCVSERREYLSCYWLGTAAGGFDLAHLEDRAPFIAAELGRQGMQVQVGSGWFMLDLRSLRFQPSPHAPADAIRRIDIMLPALNHPVVLSVRENLVRRCTLEQLDRRAPFLASELRRQCPAEEPISAGMTAVA